MQNAGGRQNAEYSHVPSKILHSVFCINHERFVIRLYNTGWIHKLYTRSHRTVASRYCVPL